MDFVVTRNGNYPKAKMTSYQVDVEAGVIDAIFDFGPDGGNKNSLQKVEPVEMARALGIFIKAEAGFSILTSVKVGEREERVGGRKGGITIPVEPTRDPIVAWCLFENITLPVGIASGLVFDPVIETPDRNVIVQGRVWRSLHDYQTRP